MCFRTEVKAAVPFRSVLVERYFTSGFQNLYSVLDNFPEARW
jgi:hypothetical protein